MSLSLYVFSLLVIYRLFVCISSIHMANTIVNRTRPAHSDRKLIVFELTANVCACVYVCVRVRAIYTQSFKAYLSRGAPTV